MNKAEYRHIDTSLRQELIGIHQGNLLNLTKQRDELVKTNERIPLILMNSIWYEEDELRALTRSIGSAEDIARHDISQYISPDVKTLDTELIVIHHGNILHLRSEERRLGLNLKSEIEYEERQIQALL